VAKTDLVAQESREAARKHFAGLLTRLRMEAHMTQKQAAERLGIDQTTVMRIELGDRAVTLEELIDFYWTYHVSLKSMPDDIWDMHQAVYAARKKAGAKEEPE
jgi:transcriptional regulator with XRE-family HTH domain